MNDIPFFIFSREEEDGDSGVMLTDTSADGEPVKTWHHDVEAYEGGRFTQKEFESLSPISRSQRSQSFCFDAGFE